MSSNPTSHFVILPSRPIVQENGEISYGPLKFHYWEWKGRQPTILFSHACSFHGRCYDRVINEALHGYHVIAIDLRGHGRSQKHPPPYHV
jgi:alpha-beta hydrolase superfamily lysophospholipase